MSITVSGTVKLDGQPLKRTFVEILFEFPWRFAIFGGEFALTDNNGHFERTFSPPAYASRLTSKIDIRIHCQNTAVRVLEAGQIDSNIHVDQVIANGGILNLTSGTLGTVYDHFRLLAQGIDVYDTVW